MSNPVNEALPDKSSRLLQQYLDRCQNLGLILDKYAPWQATERNQWDLTMQSTVRKRGIRPRYGGEAKGLWLNTQREAQPGESRSLFEDQRVDPALMKASYRRWEHTVDKSGGVAFTMRLVERMVVGLGASHVLETSLTLDRNTGLPYLPGSTLKGLARSWGLILVADQLNISLDDKVPGNSEENLLNKVAEILMSEADETLFNELRKVCSVPTEVENLIFWFRFIFGSQGQAGCVCFMDGVYAGQEPPTFAADVMTPHYVKYYNEAGGSPPSEDDNPNPVSFLTVDSQDTSFAFGIVPRRSAFRGYQEQELAEEHLAIALDVTPSWLVEGLTQLGVGGKTAAGYGFFSKKSHTNILPSG